MTDVNLEFLDPVDEIRPMNEAGEFLGTITSYEDGHIRIELTLHQSDNAVSLLKNLLTNFHETGRMFK